MKSSFECKKAESAILSFRSKSYFVLRFLLYFLCLISHFFFQLNVNNFESRPALWLKTCHFTCTCNVCKKNSVSLKMSLTTFLHSHNEIGLKRVFSRNQAFEFVSSNLYYNLWPWGLNYSQFNLQVNVKKTVFNRRISCNHTGKSHCTS